MEEIENRRREFGDELAMVFSVAGLRNLADPGGEVLANTGNLSEAGGIERGQVVGVVRRDLGAIAIRADLEGVVALDLEEVGDFPENPCNCEVIQPEGLPFRCDSRAPAPRRWQALPQSLRGGPEDRSRTDSLHHLHRTPWRRWRRRRSRAQSTPRSPVWLPRVRAACDSPIPRQSAVRPRPSLPAAGWSASPPRCRECARNSRTHSDRRRGDA